MIKHLGSNFSRSLKTLNLNSKFKFCDEHKIRPRLRFCPLFHQCYGYSALSAPCQTSESFKPVPGSLNVVEIWRTYLSIFRVFQLVYIDNLIHNRHNIDFLNYSRICGDFYSVLYSPLDLQMINILLFFTLLAYCMLWPQKSLSFCFYRTFKDMLKRYHS